ncbi:MAG: SprT-like domain-containing protein [Candidatus Acetothermia bacterium]|jgi:predicted SprT family Zn-dependent metalloprotease|nr:SprT-like domain-containing protein [Candidatus Acetothermia bacterium]MDH7506032.1 SprT-like domain-containing protein [Candidatus Acetothermia bacterium]
MSRSSFSGGDTTSGQALAEAWRRFAELNQRYFRGRLRLERLSFNPRFRSTLGTFSTDGRGRAIQLSPFYLRLFGWAELEKVLLHEMIHLQLGRAGHGAEFRKLESSIERDYGPLRPRPIPAQAHNYIYICDRCHLEFGRWRPLKGPCYHRGCGGRLWRKRGRSLTKSDR